MTWEALTPRLSAGTTPLPCVRWICGGIGSRDPVTAVRERCVGALEASSPLSVPMDLIALAEAMGVSLVAGRGQVCGRCRTAEIGPRPGGFEVRLGGAVARHLAVPRSRLEICHELAHTFFYDASERTPVRRFPVTQQEEQLCWVGARCLLLPEACLQLAPSDPRALRIARYLAITAGTALASLSETAQRLILDLQLWEGVGCVLLPRAATGRPDSVAGVPRAWRPIRPRRPGQRLAYPVWLALVQGMLECISGSEGQRQIGVVVPKPECSLDAEVGWTTVGGTILVVCRLVQGAATQAHLPGLEPR